MLRTVRLMAQRATTLANGTVTLRIVFDPSFHINYHSVRRFLRFVVTIETEVHLLTYQKTWHLAPVRFVAISALIVLLDGLMRHDSTFNDFTDLLVTFQAQSGHTLLKLTFEIASMRIVTAYTPFFINYLVFYMHAVDILALICMAPEA